MKTVSVRIREDQAKRLEQVVGYLPGTKSINGLVQDSVDNFIEFEAGVYEAAYKEAREKLKKKK